ncbi:MAG: ribosome maturation factor RimP [Pseudomonadota bacterium]
MAVSERHRDEIIEKAASSAGFELVRVRLMGVNGRQTLQIMAERPDGSMSVDDCAALSRAVSGAFQTVDPVDGEYVLEVSSPGVDRPLTRPKDFVRYEGFEAKIELRYAVEGRKRYRGRLAGFEDGAALIDLEGEDETTLIPFDLIGTAKLVMSDELLKASAPGAPTPTEAEPQTAGLAKEGETA